MKPKPYIGITGAADCRETEYICGEFLDAGYSMQRSRIPMLGFLVSSKTLAGQKTGNRRYPPVYTLASMLEKADGQVLTMIHYNSLETGTIDEQVSIIFERDAIYDSGLCEALQLNVPWPEKRQLENIKEKFPEMKIVFQASREAIGSRTPREMAAGIAGYGDVIDYVLIDQSGGRAMEMDPGFSAELYSDIMSRCPRMTAGFAGGLSGSNIIPVAKDLAQRTGSCDFCVDAEGGLRDSITQEYGDDILNFLKVRFYLKAASAVLK